MGVSDPTSTRKRKRGSALSSVPSSNAPIIDLTSDADDTRSMRIKKATKKSPAKKQTEERRLRRFRQQPTATFLEKLDRAISQRMFVIERSRAGTNEVPEELVEMAGTTGNIYTVRIGLVPSCTCPDHLRGGNQCKHIIYVLHLVLKAPDHLQYQLALLSSVSPGKLLVQRESVNLTTRLDKELREIMAKAPQPTVAANGDKSGASNRKEVSGDCPICFNEFEPPNEDIVFCKAACGNNIHRECFEQWAKSQAGSEVRCVYCRTPWQGDQESLQRICKTKKTRNAEGYTNVAEELGLSGARDYSSYHQPWVRSQGFGYY